MCRPLGHPQIDPTRQAGAVLACRDVALAASIQMISHPAERSEDSVLDTPPRGLRCALALLTESTLGISFALKRTGVGALVPCHPSRAMRQAGYPDSTPETVCAE